MMNFPLSNRLEMPILQELAATGGTEDVRFLYQKLISYFPQLEENKVLTVNFGKWKNLVQRVGKELDEFGYLERRQGVWTITRLGIERVEAENPSFELRKEEVKEISHVEIQKKLLEIGEILGYSAEMEFEFFDVVWRERANAVRLSHVFEVQNKGNIDSAFAKLKRAFDAQRSKIFLVLNNERDANRAAQSLEREFHELKENLQILSFQQIKNLHASLVKHREIIPKLLIK